MPVTDETILAGSNSESCDFRAAENANWDTLHDLATSPVYETAAILYCRSYFSGSTFKNSRMRLSWLKSAFDAAGVSLITSATVRLYVVDITENLGGKTLFLVNGGTLDAIEAKQADYAALKSSLTIYGSTLVSALSEGAYWEIELPQAALDELNEQLAAGDTCLRLGLRTSLDYTDTAPINGSSEVHVQFGGSASAHPPEIVVNGTGAPVSPPGGSSTEDQIRATSLRHLYRPGSFRLEIGLGGLSSALEIPSYEGFKSKLPEPPPSKIRPSGWYWTDFPEVPEKPKKEGLVLFPGIPGLWLTQSTFQELSKAIETSRKESTVSKIVQGLTPWEESKGETLFDWIKDIWKGIFG